MLIATIFCKDSFPLDVLIQQAPQLLARPDSSAQETRWTPRRSPAPNGKLILTPPDGLKSLGKALADNTPFPDDAFKAGAIAFGSIDVLSQRLVG